MKVQRAIFNTLGLFFVALGFIGIFLPLLPTTPFLLLAALCFSKGSQRFHAWLVEHKTLGPPIQDWQTNRVIRKRHKVTATVMIAAASAFTLSMPTIPVVGKVLYCLTISTTLAFIWSRNSVPPRS